MSTIYQVNLEGLDASKPTAGIQGRLYFTTDTGLIYYDTGSAWLNVGPSGGGGSGGFNLSLGNFGSNSNFTGTAVASLAATITNVKAGSALVIYISQAGNPTLTVTDSGGGTPVRAAGPTVSGTFYAAVYYIANAAAGSHTITSAMGTNTAYPGILILEVVGANTTTPLATTPIISTGTSTGVNTTSITTGTAKSYVLGIMQLTGGGTYSQQFGELYSTDSLTTYGVVSKPAAVAGTYNVGTYTVTGSGTYFLSAIAVNP